ncbi:hypothetical protein EJ08DRAFT_683157 [Tothia fuscella]|uniref:Transposase n=1 Tax=Tothia fuscella TaxID=1048955 RepID=A0A9P4NGZ6_9PEZI|nr:hypothetical protein EJ08DRAFT_683157 [Tothia fuscella]
MISETVHRTTIVRRKRGICLPRDQYIEMKHINQCTQYGIPPTVEIVRNMAEEMCQKQPAFLAQLIEIDTAQTIIMNINYTLIRPKVENVTRKYRILPENIYNMDEKGFLIGLLQKAKRVFNKKLKQSGKLKGVSQDGSREWITCLATISQDGTYLPPALIYQALSGNLQDTWLSDFDPDDGLAYFGSS